MYVVQGLLWPYFLLPGASITILSTSRGFYDHTLYFQGLLWPYFLLPGASMTLHSTSRRFYDHTFYFQELLWPYFTLPGASMTILSTSRGFYDHTLYFQGLLWPSHWGWGGEDKPGAQRKGNRASTTTRLVILVQVKQINENFKFVLSKKRVIIFFLTIGGCIKQH